LNIFGLKERKELEVELKQKIFFWPFKKATKRKRKIGPPLPPHKKKFSGKEIYSFTKFSPESFISVVAYDFAQNLRRNGFCINSGKLDFSTLIVFPFRINNLSLQSILFRSYFFIFG